MVFSAEAQLVGDCLEIGTCFECAQTMGNFTGKNMAILEGNDRDFMAEFQNLSYS